MSEGQVGERGLTVLVVRAKYEVGVVAGGSYCLRLRQDAIEQALCMLNAPFLLIWVSLFATLCVPGAQ